MGTSIALIYTILVLVVIFILFEAGKKKYKDFIEPLDKKEYPLKDVLPIGLQLMDQMHYGYNSPFDRKLRRQFRELKDPDYVEYYVRVQWGLATSYLMIGFLLSALLFTGMNGQLSYLFFGIGFGVLLGGMTFLQPEKEVKERHKKIAKELPDLTNKLIILSGAGLSLQAAIKKASKEREREEEEQSPLYRELSYCVMLNEKGTLMEQALEHLCIKCNMPEIRRFTAVVTQNLDRGGTDVLLAFQEIGKELWDSRRAEAKRTAEEAGTKLLFPMMFMLLAVILMVAAPAIMALNI